jgi:hypothetical protein
MVLFFLHGSHPVQTLALVQGKRRGWCTVPTVSAAHPVSLRPLVAWVGRFWGTKFLQQILGNPARLVQCKIAERFHPRNTESSSAIIVCAASAFAPHKRKSLAGKRIERGILELSEKALAEHSLAGRQPRHRLAPGLAAATHARGCETGAAQSRSCGLGSRPSRNGLTLQVCESCVRALVERTGATKGARRAKRTKFPLTRYPSWHLPACRQCVHDRRR